MNGAETGVPRALVIGAGIAGIQTSLDIANSGYEVVLVDRLPSVGGRMLQLSETFPTLDCAQCILTPRTVEVGQHERIRLYTYSEVVAVEGDVGDFRVRIRRHPAYVDWEKCTGCGICQEKCPKRVRSDFDRAMGRRKAIYTLSPQAVPNKPVIDRANCLYFQQGKCRVCERFCPTEA
ncbi:MAG: CoB--CoM heterodisulfide reductase iron-sulfur subunit A family protein, partial [Anaerolineae bacterium]|nr:CoB--CoM heterodisulfide reductase iron-sulfur subunit A family protein [Anaerolineae bacterium]